MMNSNDLKTKYVETPPASVLIVLLGAIGDVVRGFPLAARIKATWPKTRISWAVESPSVDLVKECEFVDRLIVFKRKAGLKNFKDFYRGLREESYDLSFDLQRHFKSGLTSFIAGSPTRIGFHKSNSREGNYLFNTCSIEPVVHLSDKIEQFMLFGDKIGLLKLEEGCRFGLQSSEAEKLNLEKRLGDYFKNSGIEFFPKAKRALFLIGSTWESRRWPSRHFARLSEKLFEQYGVISLIIGSKGDSVKASEIKSMAKVPICDLTGLTTLAEFKTICGLAQFGVGCDSGPLHIASAVGLPVVSVWGPTSPIRSRPYGNSQNVIQSPIGCRGCYQRVCPGLGGVCLEEIGEDIVLAMLDRVLK